MATSSSSSSAMAIPPLPSQSHQNTLHPSTTSHPPPSTDDEDEDGEEATSTSDPGSPSLRSSSPSPPDDTDARLSPPSSPLTSQRPSLPGSTSSTSLLTPAPDPHTQARLAALATGDIDPFRPSPSPSTVPNILMTRNESSSAGRATPHAATTPIGSGNGTPTGATGSGTSTPAGVVGIHAAASASTESSLSRASSARSTDSLQAKPMRTPVAGAARRMYLRSITGGSSVPSTPLASPGLYISSVNGTGSGAGSPVGAPGGQGYFARHQAEYANQIIAGGTLGEDDEPGPANAPGFFTGGSAPIPLSGSSGAGTPLGPLPSLGATSAAAMSYSPASTFVPHSRQDSTSTGTLTLSGSLPASQTSAPNATTHPNTAAALALGLASPTPVLTVGPGAATPRHGNTAPNSRASSLHFYDSVPGSPGHGGLVSAQAQGMALSNSAPGGAGRGFYAVGSYSSLADAGEDSARPSTAGAGLTPMDAMRARRPQLSGMRTESARSVGVNVRRSKDDFEFGQILGEGSYSTVLKATDKHPPHRVYAVKMIDKNHLVREKKSQYAKSERDALNRLDRSPGVVRLYWTFQDAKTLYFVLELAPNGELLHWIKEYGSFDADAARYYGALIASVLEGMHSRGVLHRDLKPENILLDDHWRIKIVDFGSAKILSHTNDANGETAQEEERATSFVGTAEYVSPEVLTSKSAYKSSDFWALGCIIYQFLLGRPPFKAPSEYLIFQKITNAEYTLPDDLAPSARSLITQLLVLKPSDRLTISQIKTHEFFEGIEWENLWKIEPVKMQTGMVKPQPKREEMDLMDIEFGDDSDDDDCEEVLDDSRGDEEDRGTAQAAGGADERQALNGSGGVAAPNGTESTPLPPRRLSTTQKLKNRGSILGFKIPKPSMPGTLRAKDATAAATALKASEGADGENGVADDEVLDQVGSEGKWANLLRPHELLTFSSPVTELTRFLSKRRTLMLTTTPRLILVKEHQKAVHIKAEVLFGATPACSGTKRSSGEKGKVKETESGAPGTNAPSEKAIPGGPSPDGKYLMDVKEEGGKVFILSTSNHSWRLTVPEDTPPPGVPSQVSRWIALIRDAQRTTLDQRHSESSVAPLSTGGQTAVD